MGRRFGQHFLSRPSILEQIAQAACPQPVPLVIEIGPGRGALTAPLLERSARVVAIEVDPVLVLYLRQKFQSAMEAGRLVLIEGDILKTDLSAWGRAVIAGNLPYYITSPILERVVEHRGSWERAVFLVQAEVADRIAAVPGSREYGYLSVFVQTQTHVERLFGVPRGAFQPPPKVDSAVIALEPRDPSDWGITELSQFLSFASLCFRQKRKTLRNNLSACYARELLDGLPEAKLRAEQLSIPQLVSLYTVVMQQNSTK